MANTGKLSRGNSTLITLVPKFDSPDDWNGIVAASIKVKNLALDGAEQSFVGAIDFTAREVTINMGEMGTVGGQYSARLKLTWDNGKWYEAVAPHFFEIAE